MTKLLTEAGQIVLVGPGQPDAAQAVSMTSEYLAGHSHAALATHSIAVLNGVSQRSVRHAEQAEHVLRGRCRAIVRLPWDDHLAEPEAEHGTAAAPGHVGMVIGRNLMIEAYATGFPIRISAFGTPKAAAGDTNPGRVLPPLGPFRRDYLHEMYRHVSA